MRGKIVQAAERQTGAKLRRLIRPRGPGYTLGRYGRPRPHRPGVPQDPRPAGRADGVRRQPRAGPGARAGRRAAGDRERAAGDGRRRACSSSCSRTSRCAAAHDVRPAAERARVGTLLDAAVLQEVRDTLESAQYVRGVLNRLADRLPLLAGRAETLDPCPVAAPGDQGQHRRAGADPGHRLARPGPRAGAAAHRLQPADGRPAAHPGQQPSPGRCSRRP